MLISGGVGGHPATEGWVPLEESISAELSPVRGNRYVRIKFRNAAKVESEEYSTHTFLKPYLAINGSSSPYTVTIADIIELKQVTILGCSETYSQVAYAESYVCSTPLSEITAKFFLTNGTEVNRTVARP
jgi:hypothetical protein